MLAEARGCLEGPVAVGQAVAKARQAEPPGRPEQTGALVRLPPEEGPVRPHLPEPEASPAREGREQQA
jgi:hypothetical protein